MAIFRKIEISFWQDDFILDLTPEEKFFYIYLMSNSKTNQLGCYEIPRKIIDLETGLHMDVINTLLERFQKSGKIEYDTETNEILLLNWKSYNWTTSPKMKTCILKDFDRVKSPRLTSILEGFFVEYGYLDKCESMGMDTHPNRVGEEEEQEQEEEEQEQDTPKPPAGGTCATEKVEKALLAEYFERFYTAYPKKRAKDKAKKAFMKLKGDEIFLDAVLDSLEKQKRSTDWKKDDGQYIPYPASWVNGGMWQDEVVPDSSPRGGVSATRTADILRKRKEQAGFCEGVSNDGEI